MRVNFLCRTSIACLAVFFVMSPRVQATPILNPANNHFYELVDATGGISWNAAVTAASAHEHAGAQGYLATITSSAENDFIVSNFGSAVIQKWLGGHQSGGAAAAGWRWITDEPWSYTNWAPNEPNDYDGDENALHYKWTDTGAPLGTWNDLRAERTEFNGRTMNGYVVEYPAYDCNINSTIENVILPRIEFNVADVKGFPVNVNFQQLLLDFAVESPEQDCLCQAKSTGSLPVSLSAGSLEVPVFTSTTTATVKLQSDGIVRWANTGFTIAPIAIGHPSTTTEPLTSTVPLSVLGLTNTAPFDQVVRKAEDYFHRRLSQEFYSYLNNAVVFADPGKTVMSVFAPDGSQTGSTPDGTIVSGISGSAYFETEAGPVVVIALPTAGQFITNLVGLETGPFEFVTYLIKDGAVVANELFSGNIEVGETIRFSSNVGSSFEIIETVIPPPGDFNNDGAVDAADYVVWRDTNGTAEQYAEWRAHFGGGSGSGGPCPGPLCNVGTGASVDSLAGAGPLSNVPEPSGFLLVAITGCVGFSVRRRNAPLTLLMAMSFFVASGSVTAATPAGCAGDYNDDGVCTDAADYVVWRNNVGTASILVNDPNGPPIGALQYNQWRARFGLEMPSGFAGAAAAGLSCDYNGDGVCDAADYTTWRDGLGPVYKQTDYETWRTGFGSTVAGTSAFASSQSAVPEPSTGWLILLGAAAAMTCRRARLCNLVEVRQSS